MWPSLVNISQAMFAKSILTSSLPFGFKILQGLDSKHAFEE